MIETNLYKAAPFLLEKMINICCLLWQGKVECEQVASNITDKDLRRAILILAQKSNQYACEVLSQIYTLGGVLEVEKIIEPEVRDKIKNLDENEILIFCKINENKMVEAYQEILNESFVYEGLKKMIRYQLNEMLCVFMQVKQLGALKLH